MNKIISLVLSLVAGLFFLIGIFVSNKSVKKDSLRLFSNSLALVVMLGLAFFDIIPELFEIFGESLRIESIVTFVCFILLGFMILKGLDLFIPDHHHEHKKNEKNHKEHDSHLAHIGVVTSLSLILHNIIEGMAITGTGFNDVKMGMMMCLGVALHNIPLGIEISCSLDDKVSKKTKNILYICLGISALVGGIIFLLLGDMNEYVLGCITSVTLGMILYITLCELLHEFLDYRKEKESKLGLCFGLIIVGISLLI